MAILSISREQSSGGREIGSSVARTLGYDFVDKVRIFNDLKAYGEKWQRLVEEFYEVHPDIWEKYNSDYQGFTALVESAIYDYALKDRVVFLGRGSNFLLGDIPHVLKVRLFAPLEIRIERAMQEDELDRETASWVIEKTDQNRAGYLRAIYGKRWADRELYDLVFNTAEQSYEEITGLLVEALKTWDQKATEESRQRLASRALAARIKARLLTDPKVFVPTLEVFHDGRDIVIRGVVHRPKEFHRIGEIAGQIAGSHPIRNELRYRT